MGNENRKKKYPVIVIISLLVILGVCVVFWLVLKNKETVSGFKKGDIVSVERKEKMKLVQNKTQEYSFEVPNEWFVEETIAPVPGVAVYDEDRKCKVDTGFLVNEKRTLDDIVQDDMYDSSPTVESLVLHDKFSGKKLVYKSEYDNTITYVAGIFNVRGQLFSIASGGEQCSHAEEYFDRTLATIIFK